MSEAEYWSLATQARSKHISRSMMGRLAKLSQDYDKALNILCDALKTKQPAAYLGKVLSNLKDEFQPPQIHIPRSHEPSIVTDARLRGWPVRKTVRGNGDPAWWVAGVLYDQGGIDVGG